MRLCISFLFSGFFGLLGQIIVMSRQNFFFGLGHGPHYYLLDPCVCVCVCVCVCEREREREFRAGVCCTATWLLLYCYFTAALLLLTHIPPRQTTSECPSNILPYILLHTHTHTHAHVPTRRTTSECPYNIFINAAQKPAPCPVAGYAICSGSARNGPPFFFFTQLCQRQQT
jgi:hypothetical protein